MGQGLLVNIDLGRGSEILRILDEAGLRVSVALWALLDEYNDWRLILVSRRLDGGSQLEAYGLVNDALRAAGFPIKDKPSIVILPMTDPTVRALRYFRQTKDVERTRIGGQQFGNRWVEDGYVYRVS